MRRVQIKGTGQNVDFPDSMTEDEMRAALQREFSNAEMMPSQQAMTPSEMLKPQVGQHSGYEPSLVEKVKDKIGGALYDSGIVSDRYGAQRIGDNVSMIAEGLPVVGDVTAGDDFGRAVQSGDGTNMLLAGLGAIPVVGDAAKAGAKAVKGSAGNAFDKISKDIPVVNPFDLIGKKVVPTLADLTDAGRAFKGIDSSDVTPIELQGGTKFPMLDSYNENNIVWAVNDKGGLKKLQKGDIIAVSAMGQSAHKSNATVNQAYLSTLDAYIRDGRISDDKIGQLNEMIRSNKEFSDFPSLQNQDEYHQWVEDLTFDKRSKFASIVESKKAQALGTPNFQKVLNETIDPDYAGSNMGDAMLLIEVDKTPDARVELGKDGTKKHRSYKYGVKGKVIGQFPKPVSNETLFPDFFARRRLAGANPEKDYRSFQLSLPEQTITEDIARSIGGEGFKSISSPRQAQLAVDFMNDNWKTSKVSKKEGGISTTDFVDALRESPSSASLTIYDPKDLNREIRQGKTNLYQLSDSKIYFGIKNDYNYNEEYGIDLEKAGLTPSEKAVVGVVNNEKGAKGVAGTSVMLKAIEEGATVLDAFAVKSKKFPDGFLPELYGEYGFSEVAKVPFDESYYDDIQMGDLKKLWGESGWAEGQPYPDVSIMKWKGNDNDRQKIRTEWLDAVKRGDESSFIGRGKAESYRSAEEAFSQQGSVEGGQVRRGQGDTGDDPRGVRNSNRTPSSKRFGDVIKEVSELSPEDAKNLRLKGGMKYTIE